MKILIDLQCCQNGSKYRGIGRYAMAMTKAIAESRCHDINILLSSKFTETVSEIRCELNEHVPQESIFVCDLIKRTESANPSNAWRTRAAEIVRAQFIDLLAPDIVFIPSLFEGFWDGIVISVEQKGAPTILTLHDLIPLDEPERYMPERRDQDAYSRKVRDARRADLILPISSFTAARAIERLGVDPGRVKIALNGVDDRFRPGAMDGLARANLLARYGIGRPFIFSASQLEYRKNIEGLLAGFGAMEPVVQRAHQLVIAGKMESDARRYIVDLATRKGLPPDTVVLPGYVPDDDLILLYQACELFAFVPLSEGFGLPPLEAMACGAPVVASNTTSLPEVIGRTDILVDPHDAMAIGEAMEGILTNPLLAAELRTYGIARGRHLSWSRTAAAALEAIDRLVPFSAEAEISGKLTGSRPSRLAFVLSSLAPGSESVGRSVALLTSLLDSFDVTIIVTGTMDGEAWLEANFEIRDADWLLRYADKYDTIVYASDLLMDDGMAELLLMHPGVVVLFDNIRTLARRSFTRPMPRSLQMALFEDGGFSAFMKRAGQTLGSAFVEQLVKGFICGHASCIITEGDNGLPALPFEPSLVAADSIRATLGLPSDVRLLLAIGVDIDTVQDNLKPVSDPALPGAAVAVCFPGDGGGVDCQGAILCLGNSKKAVHLSLHADYRGLLSAANILVLSRNLGVRLRQRIEADAAVINLDIVEEHELIADLLSEGTAKTRSARLAPRIDDIAASAWAHAIERAPVRSPSLVRRLADALPATVRGVAPSPADVHDLSQTVIANAQFVERRKLYIEVSSFASPSATKKIDSAEAQILRDIIWRGELSVQPIYVKNDQFFTANEFTGRLLEIDDFFGTDGSVAMFPGDKILGLDLFGGHPHDALLALKTSQERGAALLYAMSDDENPQSINENMLVDRLFSWADGVDLNSTMTQWEIDIMQDKLKSFYDNQVKFHIFKYPII